MVSAHLSLSPPGRHGFGGATGGAVGFSLRPTEAREGSPPPLPALTTPNPSLSLCHLHSHTPTLLKAAEAITHQCASQVVHTSPISSGGSCVKPSLDLIFTAPARLREQVAPNQTQNFAQGQGSNVNHVSVWNFFHRQVD